MGNIKVVSASAGSGKTYQLSYEYVKNVIEKPWLYRNILAVTFTNKATEEMKQRIIAEINALAGSAKANYMAALQQELHLPEGLIRARAAEVRTKILHDYSHFTILTIDKFFQRIIRSFIRELGIDINFNLELQTDSILGSATDRLIDEIPVNEKLRRWVVRFVEEKIEGNKRWDVKSELAELGQELFKERYKAIAGSHPAKEELAAIAGEALGKSRTIVNRGIETARKALGIIGESGLSATDFPYGKSGFIGYILKWSEGTVEAPGKRVADALRDETRWYAKTSPRKAAIEAIVARVMPLLAELCDIYEKNIRFLNTASLLGENFRSFALLTDLAEKIGDICAEQNLMPISETNTILRKLIADNDAPFIFEKVGTYFTHYMIDEFQDTSTQQWANFLPLLHNAVAQAEGSSVLLVGDIKQSIYRWRGGDWRILGRQVGEQFREVEFRQLETNFRSERIVVDFNNRMIEAVVRQDDALMEKLLEEADAKAAISASCRKELTGLIADAYAGHRQKVAKEQQQGYVRIVQHGESPLVRIIEELQERGYAPSDIAVVVRYNRDGRQIANELLDYKTAHPHSPYSYDVVTQEALTISSSPAVGFVIALFSLAVNPEENVKRAVYNRYLGRDFDARLPEEERSELGRLRRLSLEEAFEEVLLRYGLNRETENIAYLQALQEQVLNFSASRISDIPLFLQWWTETGSGQSISLPQQSNAITILSIHKAKGLQFKTVIVPYCNWRLAPKSNSVLWSGASEQPFAALNKIPVRYKSSMEQSYFAEDYYREMVFSHIDNINTFYVAATRAEEELYLLIPQAANHSGKISGLILGALANTGGEEEGRPIIALGDMHGSVVTDDSETRYAFGLPHHPRHQAQSPPETVPYPIRQIGTRLRFRLGSQRYFEDIPPEEGIALSPRSYGIIMHRIFEQIGNSGEIDEHLRLMRGNGTLSAEEEVRVRALIGEALENPVIRSWFDPTWEVVRNENDIVVPGGGTGRRPDRVMTRGTQAVIVDYKFGSRRENRYARQIREYISLMRGMGYKEVKGYLWYVEQGVVEEVLAENTLPNPD